MKVRFCEDNEACLKIMISGKSDALRHTERTHNVNVAWLHACYMKSFVGVHTHTKEMCADIFTKHFKDQQDWAPARRLIAHFTPAELENFVQPPYVAPPKRGGPTTAKNDDQEAAAASEAGEKGSDGRPSVQSEQKEQAQQTKANQSHSVVDDVCVVAHEHDTWEETKTQWIRHHVKPRKAFFLPFGNDGPKWTTLESKRTTVMKSTSNSSETKVDKDNWVFAPKERLAKDLLGREDCV
jgi:hypothetical protein